MVDGVVMADMLKRTMCCWWRKRGPFGRCLEGGGVWTRREVDRLEAVDGVRVAEVMVDLQKTKARCG